MSSRDGGGQSNRGDANESSPKGKNIAAVCSTDVEQLNKGLGDMGLDSSQDSGWEVLWKKNKNGAGNGAGWGSQISNPKAWDEADARRTGGRGNDGSGWAVDNVRPTQMGVVGDARNRPTNHSSNAASPPLQGGRNWKSRPGSPQYSGDDAEKRENVSSPHPCIVGEVDDGNDTEELDGSEDDLLSDDYDSDESQKSHDSRKKNPWFAEFFGTLDGLTAEQINQPARQWHCPACQNGPGSIYWYRSLPSLVTHVKTKGPQRAKLHRDLAEILEEELCRRGATVVPAGEAYGQWKGLNDVKDREIVWPPMVIIMNTQLELDENDKWIGMGSQELLDYFDSYEAVRARHSYGPKGHRGMSMLIFETSAVGYLEAERLSKHFKHQGTGRDAWDHHQNLFYPGGKRQLYGYMATERDLDVFNEHSPGKLKLKFELVSYQEKVVNQLKQMNKDNQQLHWYKNKIAKQERNLKALEEAFWLLSQKLRKLEEENRIVRQRTQLYHEQNKEEMDFQEQFFKDQLKLIQDARDAREGKTEKLQQEEHKRVEKSYADADAYQRKEKVENFMKSQTKEERERLTKLQEEERDELKSRHGKEEIEIEERFNAIGSGDGEVHTRS